MDCKEEKLVLFATTIVLQLARGCDFEDLEDLRIVINQMSSTINSLIASCYSSQKRKNKNQSK